ncbi:MAG: TadE family protein [Terriglobales bacterium]
MKRHSRGQAMVEAALVLPLLFLLVFGIVELARAANIMQTLDNAAREGAHWSAMPAAGSDNLPFVGDVQQKVVDFASASGITINPLDVSVNQEVDHTEGGLTTSFSEVQVSYTYTFITPMISALVPSLTLHGHAEMRNETN